MWAGSAGCKRVCVSTLSRSLPALRVGPGRLAVGVVEAGGRQLVALEDVARHYRRPSICDIKVGFRTWYTNGDAAYIQRCQLKDAATTQSTLGFKVCGMQARSALSARCPARRLMPARGGWR